LIIPLNTVISKDEYKFVCMSIAQQLLLKALPEHHESDSTYHGHTNATVLSSDTEQLFDVSGIKGAFASGSSTPLLAVKASTKPTTAQVAKYVKDDIMAHKQAIIDMLEASSISLMVFASLAYDLRIHGVTTDKLADLINNFNSELQTSVVESVVHEYLLDPFKEL